VSLRIWKATDELGTQRKICGLTVAKQQKQIEVLIPGLQKVSDQMELAQAAAQLVTDCQQRNRISH
jgi:hypothetical protein